MGECGNDFDCCVKYKHKYSLFDKLVLGFVLTTMALCMALMFIGLFHPQYLICN